MSYDNWRSNNEGYSCSPEIVDKDYDPTEQQWDYTFNCHNCDNKKCEYWEEFNER